MVEQGSYGTGESLDFAGIESDISDILDVIEKSKNNHDSKGEV